MFVIVDIEASNLDGDFGMILAAGVKEEGQTPVVLRHDEQKSRKVTTTDLELVLGLRDMLEQYTESADAWVTWYGTKFDLPFINARLLAHHERPLRRAMHVDLWRVCRTYLKIHSNRLQSAAEHLGVKLQKTPIRPDLWIPAMRGDRAAMDYVSEHCAIDTEVTEAVLQYLKPFIKTINRQG